MGHCLCQMSVLVWECFLWVQTAAELVQGVPSDVRTMGCSQQTQCYLELRLTSALLESGPQNRSWSSPGSSCKGNSGLLLQEKPRSRKCLMRGFDTERAGFTRIMSFVGVLHLTQKLPTRVFLNPARKRCW